MKAPLPEDEADRLACLRLYDILDTPQEQQLDDLALLASQVCGVPFSQISLVDRNRQWFKASVGLKVIETHRDLAFCAHTILHPDQVLEVRDTHDDPRFADNPFVKGGPLIRFYAGAPLVARNGHALGALCVMDLAPRRLSPEQLAALQALSRQVVAQLELRRQASEILQTAATKERIQHELHEQFERVAASQRQTQHLLELAEKSRRALLSVLEDEKRSVSNLRESEERFRQVVENIHEVFWMRDVAKRKIIYVSPGFEEIWGRKAEALYQSAHVWFDSVHADDRERIMHAVEARQPTGEFDETYRMVRPDGTIRWIRDRAYPVKGADGTVARIVGVAEDVTERKSLETQFLHAQRMEAVGALASGVAHDLNNILAPVLMIAAMLKEVVSNDKQLEMLSMIENSGRRGAAIIQQLLAFSRGLPGDRVILQPGHLVRDMVKIMQETFPRSLTIIEKVSPGLATVSADATQLHQVLMNLCVNARDAMPDGGTLTMDASNVVVTSHTAPPNDLVAGSYVLIRVKDTGHGIPPEIIGRVFEPFFTTKEVGKGTGLGLSTVVGIVRNHHGVVRVQSEVGQGTTFEIYLPASSIPVPSATARASNPLLRGDGDLILVVDDEVAILKATRSFLEEHGYRVIVAETGEQALTLFAEHRAEVRLVVTDIMMPGMGGVALCRALRQVAPETRIVAVSGLSKEQNESELERLGRIVSLEKPLSPSRLLETIAASLKH